jgi:hypothetical protein
MIAAAGLGLVGASKQSKAAQQAGAQQAASAQAGIDEQRRQFDLIRELLDPYVNAGGKGLEAQLGLMGLNGPEQQQAAIDAIGSGPEMAAMVQQGENAMLQNASATGGLRGGNTQAALAQFRPQVLSSLINQQMQRFGGLATMGQNSAAGVGTAAQTMAGNVGGFLTQQGAATSGATLGAARPWADLAGSLGGLIGEKGFGGLIGRTAVPGSTPPPPNPFRGF